MIHLAPPGRSYKWTLEAIENVNVGDKAQHWVPNGLETNDAKRSALFGFAPVELLSHPVLLKVGGSVRGVVHSVNVKWSLTGDVVQTYLEYINPFTIERSTTNNTERKEKA